MGTDEAEFRSALDTPSHLNLAELGAEWDKGEPVTARTAEIRKLRVSRTDSRRDLGVENWFSTNATKIETRAWWDCRRVSVKDPVLDPETVHLLSQVTFLSHREINKIDQLFSTMLELSELIGEEQSVREVQGVETPALTLTELRRIPEFSQNVFLRRLVRVFSQSGEETLTLFELIDLYSSLSSQATNQWKAWIAFCVFDYDENGSLDSQDLVRSVRQMILATKKLTASKLSQSYAATVLQAHQRGIATRTLLRAELPKHVTSGSDKDPRLNLGDIHEKNPLTGEKTSTVVKQCRVSMTEKAREKWTKLQLPLHVTFEEQVQAQVNKWQTCGKSSSHVEAYVRYMLNKCSGIKEGVMDFRYFESAMRKLPSFKFNFRASITSPHRMQSWISSSQLQRSGAKAAATQALVGNYLEVADKTDLLGKSDHLNQTLNTQARLAQQIHKLDAAMKEVWEDSMVKISGARPFLVL